MIDFPLPAEDFDEYDEEHNPMMRKHLTMEQKKEGDKIFQIMRKFNKVGFTYPPENYIYRLAHNDKEATKMITEFLEKDTMGVVVIDYKGKKHKRSRIMIIEPGENYYTYDVRCIEKNTRHNWVDFTLTKERIGYA